MALTDERRSRQVSTNGCQKVGVGNLRLRPTPRRIYLPQFRVQKNCGRGKYTYGKDRKRTAAFDDVVLLRAYHDGIERAICIEPGTRFRWRIMGR
jgi:hypothetical protein